MLRRLAVQSETSGPAVIFSSNGPAAAAIPPEKWAPICLPAHVAAGESPAHSNGCLSRQHATFHEHSIILLHSAQHRCYSASQRQVDAAVIQGDA
jgi:hypothetical protein